MSLVGIDERDAGAAEGEAGEEYRVRKNFAVELGLFSKESESSRSNTLVEVEATLIHSQPPPQGKRAYSAMPSGARARGLAHGEQSRLARSGRHWWGWGAAKRERTAGDSAVSMGKADRATISLARDHIPPVHSSMKHSAARNLIIPLTGESMSGRYSM